MAAENKRSVITGGGQPDRDALLRQLVASQSEPTTDTADAAPSEVAPKQEEEKPSNEKRGPTKRTLAKLPEIPEIPDLAEQMEGIPSRKLGDVPVIRLLPNMMKHWGRTIVAPWSIESLQRKSDTVVRDGPKEQTIKGDGAFTRFGKFSSKVILSASGVPYGYLKMPFDDRNERITMAAGIQAAEETEKAVSEKNDALEVRRRAIKLHIEFNSPYSRIGQSRFNEILPDLVGTTSSVVGRLGSIGTDSWDSVLNEAVLTGRNVAEGARKVVENNPDQAARNIAEGFAIVATQKQAIKELRNLTGPEDSGEVKGMMEKHQARFLDQATRGMGYGGGPVVRLDAPDILDKLAKNKIDHRIVSVYIKYSEQGLDLSSHRITRLIKSGELTMSELRWVNNVGSEGLLKLGEIFNAETSNGNALRGAISDARESIEQYNHTGCRSLIKVASDPNNPLSGAAWDALVRLSKKKPEIMGRIRSFLEESLGAVAQDNKKVSEGNIIERRTNIGGGDNRWLLELYRDPNAPQDDIFEPLLFAIADGGSPALETFWDRAPSKALDHIYRAKPTLKSDHSIIVRDEIITKDPVELGAIDLPLIPRSALAYLHDHTANKTPEEVLAMALIHMDGSNGTLDTTLENQMAKRDDPDSIAPTTWASIEAIYANLPSLDLPGADSWAQVLARRAGRMAAPTVHMSLGKKVGTYEGVKPPKEIASQVVSTISENAKRMPASIAMELVLPILDSFNKELFYRPDAALGNDAWVDVLLGPLGNTEIMNDPERRAAVTRYVGKYLFAVLPEYMPVDALKLEEKKQGGILDGENRGRVGKVTGSLPRERMFPKGTTLLSEKTNKVQFDVLRNRQSLIDPDKWFMMGENSDSSHGGSNKFLTQDQALITIALDIEQKLRELEYRLRTEVTDSGAVLKDSVTRLENGQSSDFAADMITYNEGSKAVGRVGGMYNKMGSITQATGNWLRKSLEEVGLRLETTYSKGVLTSCTIEVL